jgi:hypothetical protein
MLAKDVLNILSKKRESIAGLTNMEALWSWQWLILKSFCEIEDEHDSVELIEELIEG